MEKLSLSKENPFKKLGFIKGQHIQLEKRIVEQGFESKVISGTVLSGNLKDDIHIGSAIFLDNGANTTSISNFFEEDGHFFVKTRTSVYEIRLENNETISGLELKNKYGWVHTPFDAKIAELGEEIIDIAMKSEKNDFSFYINKEKLQGVLLEVNNGQLFRAVQGRMMVVAKVGDGHLPFYVSSAGTSGKRAGEWYPFFGYTGTWLVKGHITNKDTGDMYYSDTIQKVQDLLNENFRFPASYISPRGKFGTEPDENGIEPTKIYANLSKMLKYQNYMFDEKYKDKSDAEYVQRITGYNPEKVVNDGGRSADAWINNIVKSLG